MEFFFEVAEHELAPLVRQTECEEPDGVGRWSPFVHHGYFDSSRVSKPPAIAVKAR